MAIYQAVILAIVQALTEFLPISSSAHLALAPWLLGWRDQGLTFDIALHFGTLAAVLIYFFRDWLQLTAQAFGIGYSPDPELRLNRSMFWLLVLATIPVGIVGLLLKDYAETALRNPFIIGFMLIAIGILMGWADKCSRRDRAIGTITLGDAMVIGTAQALALVPGTSRSGITITAGLLRNIDRYSAARFSFLLSTPAVAAAALDAGYDLWKAGGVPAGMVAPFVVGIMVSAVVGCAVIAFLLQFLRSNSLKVFVWYRIIFGIIVIALAVFFREAAG